MIPTSTNGIDGRGVGIGGMASQVMDGSQNNNTSGCFSNSDSVQYIGVKQEIDLLELCNDVNENSFNP